MKRRMLAALVGLSVGVLLVHDVPLASYLRNVENDRLVTGLERDSFIIVGNAHEAIEEPSRKHQLDLERSIQKYVAQSNAVVIVTDGSGLVIASTDPSISKGDDFSARPEISQALSGTVASGRRFSNTLNYELLYVSVPVIKGNEVFGSVRITFPAQTVDQIVNSRLRILGSVAGVTILLAILLALLLASSITKRLDDLKTVTEEFAAGNYGVRADTNHGASEIRTLSESFNSMAERISLLIAQQRDFASDASHQLRTPLTALQLRLERAQSLVSDDSSEVSERIDAALVETGRLQQIVEGLLMLSRVESRSTGSLEMFDLAQVVKTHSAQWQALASDSGVQLDIEVPDTARIVALPGVIEQVVDNYVDNALHVSRPGSRIVIQVVSGEDFSALHVIDDGPGLSEEGLDKAFNRFWRAKSDEHGSGLGLAIVERLMLASGGSAELMNRQPNGIDARAFFRNV